MQVSDVDVAGEPEARRIARARRLAEQARRIAEQVAAQQAAEAEKEAAKDQRGDIREQLKPRIEVWQTGKKVSHLQQHPAAPLTSRGKRQECKPSRLLLVHILSKYLGLSRSTMV